MHYVQQALVLGLVIGSIFYQLPETPAGIRSRYGLMYIVISAEPYILLIIQVNLWGPRAAIGR